MSKAFKVDDDLTIYFDVVKAKDLMAGDVIFHVEYAAFYEVYSAKCYRFTPGRIALDLILRGDQLCICNPPLRAYNIVLPSMEMHKVRPC